MLGQAEDVREAGGRVVVETELGRLDRDLAVDPGGHDPVGQLEVVGRDLIGLGQALEVLAEPRVERGDAGRLERERRLERVVQGLAGHEPPHRPAHEPEAGQVGLQPAVPGGPQEDPPHASSFMDRSDRRMLRDDAG